MIILSTVAYPRDQHLDPWSLLHTLKIGLRTLNSTKYTLIHTLTTRGNVSSSPNDISTIRQRLSDCSADFMSWCAARRLQLNADKTEVMFETQSVVAGRLGPHTHCRHRNHPAYTSVVGHLGVWLDSELSLKQHVFKVAKACRSVAYGSQV